MAQLLVCDKCERTASAGFESVSVRGIRVDLCAACMDDVFGPWLATAVARANTVPTVPPTATNRWPRPPTHGHTAAAIEAAQNPALPAADS